MGCSSQLSPGLFLEEQGIKLCVFTCRILKSPKGVVCNFKIDQQPLHSKDWWILLSNHPFLQTPCWGKSPQGGAQRLHTHLTRAHGPWISDAGSAANQDLPGNCDELKLKGNILERGWIPPIRLHIALPLPCYLSPKYFQNVSNVNFKLTFNFKRF